MKFSLNQIIKQEAQENELPRNYSLKKKKIQVKERTVLHQLSVQLANQNKTDE